jgi:hypothetical protein
MPAPGPRPFAVAFTLLLCSTALAQARYSLPDSVGLGAATVHRYVDPRVLPSRIAVTMWVPTSEERGCQLLDLNRKTVQQSLPRRCVIGDGSARRSFIGVDLRPGTPLDQALARIEAQMPRGRDGRVAAADAIEFVRRETGRLIRWTPGSQYNDGRPELEWDRAIAPLPDAAWGTFSAAADRAVGAPPLLARARFPVVPFERWLEAGQGYCLQKALLGTLLLERAGVPCRLVQGAVAQGPGWTSGHTWIDLGDGRVLDPAWGCIERPRARDAQFPDRFQIGSSFRFESQCYPYLAFPERPE